MSTPEYHNEQYIGTGDLDPIPNLTTLPSPESATVRGSRLTLTFDAPLKEDRTPDASAFTVTVDGSEARSVTSVSVSGKTVTLTLASAVAAGADVKVSYERPSSRRLQNVICEYAPSFTNEPVTNLTQ